ncbi:MAG: type II toxin-antitoxin system RelE/ParE family toxin [Thiothrix litoralis]|uniref:type II toxin-antitoxin system RelE/ParE family toxin n=1 Tax=Thiothrix litoralis TaxID=2891210 RepID=UPI003C72357E
MLKTFHFHPAARQELDETIHYYDSVQPGLGLDFLEEAYATIQRILDYPEAWSTLSANTRRCLTNRFPYGLIYQIQDNGVLIVAVTHLNRKPGYWQERDPK